MIKVLNYTASKLIAPNIRHWDVGAIVKHPQTIHYIDCSKLDGYEWYLLLRYQPQFEELCTKYNGWGKIEWWEQLLSTQPQFEKYKK